MARLTFTDEKKQALRTERFELPHPRVQLRMEVLWLISLGETQSNAARLAGVSEPTVDRYVAHYREPGIEGPKQFNWKTPTSELVAHQASVEEMFRADPPHTTAEANWKRPRLLCRCGSLRSGSISGLSVVRVPAVYSRCCGPYEIQRPWGMERWEKCDCERDDCRHCIIGNDVRVVA